MIPVPEALRGVIAAMWEREFADGLARLAATPSEAVRTAAVEIALFNEIYEQCRSLLREDELLILSGRVSRDDYSGGWRFSTDRVMDLTMARQEHGRALCLRMNGASDAVRLKALLDPFRVQTSALALDGVFTADDNEAAPLPRGCPVEIEYHNHAARCAVRLGDAWRIRPDEALLVELRRWLSDTGVELRYA